MASFLEQFTHAKVNTLQEGILKNRNHIREIADTVFKDNMWRNISDVYYAALLIHAGKQTKFRLSGASGFFV